MIMSQVFRITRNRVNFRSQRCLSTTCTNSNEFRSSEDMARERYEGRSNEDIERKKARLLYQSRKRGMLENGVILASFADKYIEKMDTDELDQYDRLINLPTNDWDIYYWATNTKPTPNEFETPIMTKLRQHLNSKVSNGKLFVNQRQEVLNQKLRQRYKSRDQYFNRSRQDDIAFEPKKKTFDLNPDFSSVDLVNYKDELYDDRFIRIGSKLIPRMTEYRREYALKRLRRTLPSPISIKNMNDSKQPLVYTQEIEEKDLCYQDIQPKDICDKPFERSMKHHQFLQFLLSSKFTRDALEYDDEAEAWADMVWHRNYGNFDRRAKISDKKCSSCNNNLHCCDPGLEGYTPYQILAKIIRDNSSINSEILCQCCRFKQTYKSFLKADINLDQFDAFIKQISKLKNSVAVILVDLTDFPGTMIDGLIDKLGKNYFEKIILVGNKVDLLPWDTSGMLRRIKDCLISSTGALGRGAKNLRSDDIVILSARTGFNVESLISRLSVFTEEDMDMYLIGAANTGKTTLFNALLQSDLSANRLGDLLGRIGPYNMTIGDEQTNLSMLRFPINHFEGWEISLKQSRTKMTTRDVSQHERSFLATTRRRQDQTPHISMLINHIDYPQISRPPDSSNLVIDPEENNDNPSMTLGTSISLDTKTGGCDILPAFSEDHPLMKVVSSEPLSAAQQDNFEDDSSKIGFFHHTPSITTPDQLHELLTVEERIHVFPNSTLSGRKFTLRPLQSIFIAGLARLDLLTANDFVMITVFVSKYLPIHVLDTKLADRFYSNFIGTPYLGVPFGHNDRIKAWPGLSACETNFHIRSDSFEKGQADIILSSLGWAMVSIHPDQECLISAHTPDARGISIRQPPLLPYFRTQLKQRKVKDSPIFCSPGQNNKRFLIS